MDWIHANSPLLKVKYLYCVGDTHSGAASSVGPTSISSSQPFGNHSPPPSQPYNLQANAVSRPPH
jgi:hypothetical protein